MDLDSCMSMDEVKEAVNRDIHLRSLRSQVR